MKIDRAVLLARSVGPVETTVGTEIVLMSLESGECMGLGETGSAVWRLLGEPNRLGPMVQALSATYDAPAEVIERDVAELLEEMVRRGLLEIR